MTTLHAQLVVANAVLRRNPTAPHRENGGLGEGEADAGVHDDNKAERSEVDVSEEDSGVDFTHLLIGPVFPAPVERTGVVVAAKNYSHPLLLCDLEHDPRGTHDGHSQDPYDDDN